MTSPAYIIGQIIGVIAVAGTFVSYQTKTQKQLLIVNMIATALFCVHYMLLGASSGMVLNLFAIVRNIIYCNRDKKPLSHPAVPYILGFIIMVLGATSWQGWYSLFIIVGLVINTVIMSYDDNQLIRKSILLTSSLILIYNLFIFSVGGMINETVAIVSSIVGILRTRKAKA